MAEVNMSDQKSGEMPVACTDEAYKMDESREAKG